MHDARHTTRSEGASSADLACPEPMDRGQPPMGADAGRLAMLRAWLAGWLPAAERGSLVTEYGLIAIIGATIAGLAIKWASGGAIFELFGAILARVKVLVGV